MSLEHPAKSSDLLQGDYGQILEAQVYSDVLGELLPPELQVAICTPVAWGISGSTHSFLRAMVLEWQGETPFMPPLEEACWQAAVVANCFPGILSPADALARSWWAKSFLA